jgi:hypothetical protein
MSYCPYCNQFTKPTACDVPRCGGLVCGTCGNCNRRERFHPEATPQHARPASPWRASFFALALMAAAFAVTLSLTSCAYPANSSDPAFSCRIAGGVLAGGSDWAPEIRITGPTPSQGVLNVNLAYFDAAGSEIGSDDYIPIGFSGVSVPAGKTLTVVLDSEYDPGLSESPHSCQVTGYM